MISFSRKLDQRRFLGFHIWEFSLHSLFRLYGRLFVWHIVLRHPFRTLKGLLAYRRFSRQGHWDAEIIHLHDGEESALRAAAAGANGAFLVALGFCQKPLGVDGPTCPAGRFNHECHVLGRDDVLDMEGERLPAACRDCDVRTIGVAALRAGAALYIMTSAADIARHLFIPTLAHARFQYGLFLQCPYSIPAMALPLLICGIQSILIEYRKGDCRDYAQFLLADEGTKYERTFLSRAARTYVLSFLQNITSTRMGSGGENPLRFRREGALYVPKTGD
jgi:hypothetical protein